MESVRITNCVFIKFFSLFFSGSLFRLRNACSYIGTRCYFFLGGFLRYASGISFRTLTVDPDRVGEQNSLLAGSHTEAIYITYEQNRFICTLPLTLEQCDIECCYTTAIYRSAIRHASCSVIIVIFAVS